MDFLYSVANVIMTLMNYCGIYLLHSIFNSFFPDESNFFKSYCFIYSNIRKLTLKDFHAMKLTQVNIGSPKLDQTEELKWYIKGNKRA